MLQEVDKEKEGQSENESAEAKAHGIDISDDLEKDLCTLWDMSANKVSKDSSRIVDSECFIG